jgi:hypothetical protein
MATKILSLLIAFQLKHFLADFPLQGKYMLGKFKGGTEWILPLVAHAGVHAGFTLLIVAMVDVSLWWLALVDFALHFTMDRIKASPYIWGKYPITDKKFWWALGVDQMVHHLTHYFIIWRIIEK